MRSHHLPLSDNLWWVWLVVAGYTAVYGTRGINETDGGFLSGLAWQLLSGKVLYREIVYVRPPLPVWERAMEIALLPQVSSVLWERLLFYGKVGLYCAAAARVLLPERRGRGWLAVLAFVVSAHNYPAAAWHTVDGLLWGALGLWVLFCCRGCWAPAIAGGLLAACMLCKQSFYPMAAVGVGAAVWAYGWRCGAQMALGLCLGWSIFAAYLWTSELWMPFWSMTSGATSWKQAWQHGVVDYFRIRPWVAIVSAAWLVGMAWCAARRRHGGWALGLWAAWLIGLGAVYGWDATRRGEFTLPFAQLRLLFWVSNAYALWQWRRGEWSHVRFVRYGALAALSWCSALSWGYNLPILFSAPWVFALWDISQRLQERASAHLPMAPAAAVVAALLLFGYSYQWVYRDGHRSEMTAHLGDIFPALRGIYSTPQKAALYRELANLTNRHGPNWTVLPAFTQAHFLTRTAPPLPLDWVVAREMGRRAAFVEAEAQRVRPVFFLQKSALEALYKDPELELVRRLFERGQRIEETPFFIVFRLP